MKSFIYTFLFAITLLSIVSFIRRTPSISQDVQQFISSPIPQNSPITEVKKIDLKISPYSQWTLEKIYCNESLSINLRYPRSDQWHLQYQKPYSLDSGCEIWLTYPVSNQSPQQINPDELLRLSLKVWNDTNSSYENILSDNNYSEQEQIGEHTWNKIKVLNYSDYITKIDKTIVRITPISNMTYHDEKLDVSKIDQLNKSIIKSISITY